MIFMCVGVKGGGFRHFYRRWGWGSRALAGFVRLSRGRGPREPGE